MGWFSSGKSEVRLMACEIGLAAGDDSVGGLIWEWRSQADVRRGDRMVQTEASYETESQARKQPVACTVRLPARKEVPPVKRRHFFFEYAAYFSAFSHCWLATPQLVLQADWQEVWHSPQPPFLADSHRLRVSRVLILSMIVVSHLKDLNRT